MRSLFVRNLLLVILVASAIAWSFWPESGPLLGDCAPCAEHPSVCLCMEPVLIHARR